MKHFQNQLQNKHLPIVEYFQRNGFGSSRPVMTYLSTLKPIDRCIILEKLFEERERNIDLYDKLVLSYVKVGRPDFGHPVIEYAREMGEDEFNCWGMEQKLGLGIPPDRRDEERMTMFQEYLSNTNNPKEMEFLNLLVKFINS